MPSQRPTTILRDAGILFLGVLAATWLIDGIQAESTPTLVIVAIVLTLLNMVVKPLLVLFTLPFVIFTLGLGILIINAILLFLAGQLVPGFEVLTFGTAFLGALVISLVSFMVNIVLAPKSNVRVAWSVNRGNNIHRSRKTINKKDVIDV
ncbi:MAG: phage holin family protein [Opitutales bacterium]|jgi:putative membrane protein